MKADLEMEKIIKFGDIETEKQNFHQHKEPISIENIDIDKITVSSNVPFVKKDWPLCISSPKMTEYRKDFNETKFMSILIKDD